MVAALAPLTLVHLSSPPSSICMAVDLTTASCLPMILMLVCVQQRLVYEEHCWKLGGKEKGETRDFLSFSGVVSLVVAIPVSWLQLFSRQTLPDATFSRVPQAPPLLFVPPAKVSTVFLLLPISGFVTVSFSALWSPMFSRP